MARSTISRVATTLFVVPGLIVTLETEPADAVSAGWVTLASHTAAGVTTTGNGAADDSTPAVSADGSFVAFSSYAADLVAGQVDANAERDVFLLERSTGAITLVSHVSAVATTTADRLSSNPVISADGRFVAFSSSATNLVSGQNDANGRSDSFVFDRTTGTVTLVSHVPASSTTTADQASRVAAISADGAFVLFGSEATNLVPGQGEPAGSPSSDVFLYERATATVTLVSHAAASATTTGNRSSFPSSISADGAYVTYESAASDLVSGQTDGPDTSDAFLFSRATGSSTLVSHVPGSATTTGDAGSWSPLISANGNVVSFHSLASNLVAGQSNYHAPGTWGYNTFLFDRGTGAVTLVSHVPGAATSTSDGDSFAGPLSADGSFMAFVSTSTNVANVNHTDAFNTKDVFLYERATGKVTLLSHRAFLPAYTPSYETGAGLFSDQPSISADGAFVAYRSLGFDLVRPQNDANGGNPDVFLYDRAAGRNRLVSDTPDIDITTGNGPSQNPVISADGGFVAFTSSATNMVPGQVDTNGGPDVFLSQVHADLDGPPPADFDGDGRTDQSVFRPSDGTWYISFSSGGVTAVPFGTVGDVPVAADYDGDGRTDVAVFRPSVGVWFIQASTAGQSAVAYGTSGDLPVPADYDGDGRADIAVYRPDGGFWFIQKSTGGQTIVQFGTNGDVPVPADFDGDGSPEIAVFRPSIGVWFIHGPGGDTATAYGTTGDVPLPADYDGDGRADITVYRPSDGRWYVLQSTGAQAALQYSTAFPVPGDYDGDGKADPASFYPAGGYWNVRKSSSPDDIGSPSWGGEGDVPAPLPPAVGLLLFP